jgi:putative GTP pyrophosphokinase
MSNILSEFDANEALYRDFSKELKRLVAELLSAEKFQVHSVSCRLKERLKLERKISSAGSKYKSLADVTDVAGVRVTTFFANDIDRVSKVIEQEFLIDWDNSIDKRATLDPDRFGYLSLHYVVSFGPGRGELLENRRFAGLKAEIQMRSILQHAWAEIEHDIGYKSQLALPREVRRRFSRLAGLLELADSEFIAIRAQLADYEAEISKEIQQAPESVSIDKLSLSAFIESNALITKLDNSIAGLCSAQIDPNVHSSVLEGDVAVFDFLGFKTIAELDKILTENENAIIAFAKHWLTTKQKSVVRGVSLLYLTYVVTARSRNRDTVLKALGILRVGASSERAELAERVLTCWDKVKL